MSLGTYTDLKASVADWLRRTDLTATIPDFIALAEAQINRRLKAGKIVGVSAISIDAEYVDVPADFGGVVSLSLDTNPTTDLRGYDAPSLTGLVASRYYTPAKPQAYAVVGSQFRFAPAPDATYSAALTYYQGVAALSDAAPTNWLLTDHPDVYLYGALTQSAPYLRADERLATWSALFTTALDDLIINAERERHGARPARRMRSLG